MRKLLALLLMMLVFCVPVAFAENSIDFSALTIEELEELIDLAQKEIDNREVSIQPNDSYVFPCEILNVGGYRLEIKSVSSYAYNGTLHLEFDVLAENTSPYDIEIDLSFVSIDEWDVRDSMFTEAIEISAGKKATGNMSFTCRGVEKDSIDEIESFEFELSVWDKGRSLYNLYRSEILKGKFE
jgi:hypothetical protein